VESATNPPFLKLADSRRKKKKEKTQKLGFLEKKSLLTIVRLKNF